MLKIANKIYLFLTSKLNYFFMGIVAVSSLIWFVGDSLQLSILTKLIILVLFVIVPYIILVSKKIVIKKRGERLANHLQSQNEALAGRQLEVEVLKEKMSEAIAFLKASELGVNHLGNAALYALPWYMVIGASASGKSTLLRNSGLRFPVTDHSDIQVKGFGGTRNCDWWFTEQAVLLDTAGRYTTENNDHDEWLNFLKILKRGRPRLPINGILVTVNIVEILTAPDKNILWHVKVIRDRIAELYKQLGYIFPVYLVFTKCDLLQGFNEFFMNLTEEERSQVWGIYLANNDNSVNIDYITQQLVSLYHRLTEFRFYKLAAECNQKRKIAIYDFPEQFHAAQTKLNHFIKQLLMENPYQETPNFYGVYFTSGTQEGTPIARLLGNMQKAFEKVNHLFDKQTSNIPAETTLVQTITKSYFIKELFSKVIFPANQQAAKTKQRLRIRFWLKSIATLLIIIATLCVFMLYSTVFTDNVLLLRRGDKITDQFVPQFPLHKKQLTQHIESIMKGYQYFQSLVNYQQHHPWYLRLGLYQGETQLQPLRNILLAEMENYFDTPLFDYLQRQLQHFSRQWSHADRQQREKLRGAYYVSLKAYLMLAFPTRLNSHEAASLLAMVWKQLLINNKRKQLANTALLMNTDAYTSLIKFYLQNLIKKTHAVRHHIIDQKLVQLARRQLGSLTNADNLYAQMLYQGKVKLAVLSLRNSISGYSASLLRSDSNVPGVFTVKGWQTYVQPAIKHISQTASQIDWVTAMPLEQAAKNNFMASSHDTLNKQYSSQLAQNIRMLYFADYAKAWFNFLSSIRITHFSSLTDAAKQLTVLTNRKGPLVQLFNIVSDNINVLEQNGQQQISELNSAFGDLQHLINPHGKEAASKTIKNYLHELTLLSNALKHLAASSTMQRDVRNYTIHILNGSDKDLALYRSSIAINLIVNQLDNIAARRAVYSVLLQPIRETWRMMLATAAHGLQQQWQDRIVSIYQQTLANKFPFNRYASEDASIRDTSNFFAPTQGYLWSFIHTYLLPYLVADQNGWHQQKWLGIDENFSSHFLAFLMLASHISNGLFADNHARLGFAYQVYPIPTPGISQIILTVSDVNFRYRNGPQRWYRVQWPSHDINENQLTAIAAHGLSPQTLTAQGPWGLFHLLARGHITTQQPGTYKVTWRLPSNEKNYHINLLFKMDPINNVIKALLMKPFVLPKRIFTVNG